MRELTIKYSKTYFMMYLYLLGLLIGTWLQKAKPSKASETESNSNKPDELLSAIRRRKKA